MSWRRRLRCRWKQTFGGGIAARKKRAFGKQGIEQDGRFQNGRVSAAAARTRRSAGSVPRRRSRCRTTEARSGDCPRAEDDWIGTNKMYGTTVIPPQLAPLLSGKLCGLLPQLLRIESYAFWKTQFEFLDEKSMHSLKFNKEKHDEDRAIYSSEIMVVFCINNSNVFVALVGFKHLIKYMTTAIKPVSILLVGVRYWHQIA